MLYPMSHRKYLDIIIKAIHKNSYMYGSRKYGWMSYYHPATDIMLNRCIKYGISNEQLFEIYNNDFLVNVDIHYPAWRTQFTGDDTMYQRVYSWNDVYIDPDYDLENSNPSGISHMVEYLGDLYEIESAATILSLTEESIFET